ncbi:MAG: hypothetical protein Q8M08_05680 [Bacteroidales bacterium]|nr:hypothetical protein [Bacteroidales bacterium]
MADNQLLIQKLDHFIRKYYKNRLIRGGLWALTLLAVFYLVFVSLEYFFHFSQNGRMVLFFTFVGLSLFLLARLVFTPTLQLVKIGKIISHDQAAQIVGTHFSEIQDKLLNTLQLINQQKNAGESSDLLAASIEQKTNTLKVFQFSVVVDFRKNLRYLRYFMIPVAIILLLVAVSPKIISDPTQRIIMFNQTFIPPLPYKITIQNKTLTAIQQEDFELQVKVTGTEIPSEMYVNTKEGTFKMVRNKGFVFTHLFKSLQGSISFRIVTGEYKSESYELKVYPKPTILNFEVSITYPAYINKPVEKFENKGDFVVPEGSAISWNFYTKDVSMIKMRFDIELITLKKENSNIFKHTSKAGKSVSYSITPVNANTSVADSLKYRINVVNDGFPSIFVTESQDSLLATNIFFKGTIKDDYGFTNLTFNYSVFSKGDTSARKVNIATIPIDKSINNQIFYYAIDLIELLPVAGQNIQYYFEIWDNDGIHGPKATKSELKTISTPTLEEIARRTDMNEQFINQDFEKSLLDAKAMKKTMEELNKKLVDQTAISWQEKKKIEDLIKSSEAIEKQIDQIKKKNTENIATEEKHLETSERIIEKQKQLNEMMDQMFSEEMKKMIREMKELLNQIDKEKLGNLLEKMKMSNKELETQLDRNLALMKQIEFDRKLETTINDLRKNAEKQEKIAEATEKQTESLEKLIEKQNEVNQKADSIAEKIKELEKEGKELETPADLGNTKDKQDSISKSLSESTKKLNEKKTKEASGKQKKAAKEMNELAQQMEESQQDSEDEQLAEDADNIRMILENLVRLSFDQEEMIAHTRQIARNDPRYTELVYRQKEFSGKMQVVEDSLIAIARRQIEIKPIITREIAAINLNVELALEAMETRNINMAVAKQQFAMTSINNLALLLNESLQRMNAKMSPGMQSKGGKKSCPNPGGKGKGKSSAKSMKEMQDAIGKQLGKLKAGMEGAKKDGKGNMQGQQGMSREVAKLAAQQEALRNEMQKYQDEMGLKGIKDQGSLNEAAKEMEQIEKDLINKRITQETIRRQQNIMSRLLESEKAEQMRDQEEKRESTEAKTQPNSNPGLNYEYNIKKRASQDNINLVLPGINSFYKSKVNSYIVKIEN